jgi:sigma-E factor negative regulatory protein RseC
MNGNITHQGKVERIDKNKVFVRIEQKAACSECHAASVCLVSDKKDKIIEVNDYSGSYALQEEVLISGQSSMGLYAVVIAYAIPLLVVLIVVVAGIYISKSEVIGSFAGLVLLLAYYFTLYLMRDKIKKKLLFTISKNQD